VLDAAVLLQAIAGYDAKEPNSVDRPVPVWTAAIKRSAASLRVGVPREYFFTGLQADVQTAVEQAIGVLAKLTAGVQEVFVPVSPEVNLAVMLAEGFAFHAARVRETPQLFQPPVLGASARRRGREHGNVYRSAPRAGPDTSRSVNPVRTRRSARHTDRSTLADTHRRSTGRPGWYSPVCA
jgi:Asp-tRNA(Asn)/Glu-tRNA(Gln) amidotransferase A subunit family amidase